MTVTASNNYHPGKGKSSAKDALDERKRYASPELVVYGSLLDLTRSANDPPFTDPDGAGSIQTG